MKKMMDMMDMMMRSNQEKKKLPEDYKSIKGGILKDLMREMSGMMGEDLKGMKKVTVAAPDAEGLKEGLEKAEEMMPDANEAIEDEAEGEMCPECGMQHEDGQHMMEENPEALKAKIKELEMKLAAKGE